MLWPNQHRNTDRLWPNRHENTARLWPNQHGNTALLGFDQIGMDTLLRKGSKINLIIFVEFFTNGGGGGYPPFHENNQFFQPKKEKNPDMFRMLWNMKKTKDIKMTSPHSTLDILPGCWPHFLTLVKLWKNTQMNFPESVSQHVHYFKPLKKWKKMLEKN